MALTKETIEDKIEIVGDYKSIQVRTATIIKEGAEEISRSFHRKVLDCVTSSYDPSNGWTHTDTDISAESTEVQAICNAVWTNSIKDARKTFNENTSIS